MGWFSRIQIEEDIEIGKRARKHREWEEKQRKDAIKKRVLVAREKEIAKQKADNDRKAAEKMARDRRTIEERARAKRAGDTTRQNNRWW